MIISDENAKIVVYSSNIHDYICSADFTFTQARWAPMHPQFVDMGTQLVVHNILQFRKVILLNYFYKQKMYKCLSEGLTSTTVAG